MVEVYVKQVNRSSRSLVMLGQEVHAREGRWWSGMSMFAGNSPTQTLTLVKNPGLRMKTVVLTFSGNNADIKSSCRYIGSSEGCSIGSPIFVIWIYL
jgi:hypothetical protein